MGKTIKPENVLTEEDKNSITSGVSTISQVSKDKNIPYGSVYSQVKNGKLAVTFEKDVGGGNIKTPLPDFKEPEPTKIIDYTASVSNFWAFIDMIFRFICPLFRLDYTGMDKVTIDDLTEKTKDKLGSLITGHTYVDWLGTVGVIGYTFVTRIKIKAKDGLKKEEKKEASKHTSVESSSGSHNSQIENKGISDIKYTEGSNKPLEPTKDSEYKLTEDGLVISDLSVDDIKKKLGIQ